MMIQTSGEITVHREPWWIDRLTLTVAETAEVTGVSVRHVRTMTSSGELPSKKLGERILIPVDALRSAFGVESGADHE